MPVAPDRIGFDPLDPTNAAQVLIDQTVVKHAIRRALRHMLALGYTEETAALILGSEWNYIHLLEPELFAGGTEEPTSTIRRRVYEALVGWAPAEQPPVEMVDAIIGVVLDSAAGATDRYFNVVTTQFAEVELAGPYPSAQERDEAAPAVLEAAGGAGGGANVAWLDVSADGRTEAGAYSDGRW